MRKYRTIWMALLQWGLIWTSIIGCSLAWNRHLIREQVYSHDHPQSGWLEESP